jgi:release factor glutamine methyltransferase
MDLYTQNLIARLKKEKYNNDDTVAFLRDSERLANGEPYEYVLGYTEFLDAHIDLSLRPMIPRPESAFWVKRAIQELEEKQSVLKRPLRMAELFAGSGNIGLALLVHFKDAEVDICEVDPKLKEQIEINLQKNNIEEGRAHAITASGLTGLTRKYDAIFAIPPYIPYAAKAELDQDMIDYEPHLAFFAHDDGHEYHELLIAHAHEYLHTGGVLYMEADMDHDIWIRERVTGTMWSHLELWPDPYGATPNVVLRK